jgi:uncharacterized protein YigA (DUF484 family)
MSQHLTHEETGDELSWEDAVARYLEDHPDYFDRYPQLLACLKLGHDTGGRAVSLIEKQVQVLRDQNESSQRQLRELLAIARENDVLGQRLHRYSLVLLDAQGPDEALEAALELLRSEFHLDAVAVRLGVDTVNAGTRAEYVAPDNSHLNALLRQFTGGKPICGGKFDSALSTFLFGDDHHELRSSALVPLGARTTRGVLALGSRDPNRFHAGQGTVVLSRLGELLAATLERVPR